MKLDPYQHIKVRVLKTGPLRFNKMKGDVYKTFLHCTGHLLEKHERTYRDDLS